MPPSNEASLQSIKEVKVGEMALNCSDSMTLKPSVLKHQCLHSKKIFYPNKFTIIETKKTSFVFLTKKVLILYIASAV